MMTRTETDLLDLISAWDGEALLLRFEPKTESWIIIALHSTRLGRATGGTRMKSYPSVVEAALDATRLAGGMTDKWAALGLGIGGGKAVLAIPRVLDAGDRTHLLEQYGRLLASLGGCFRTGADLGTTPADMGLLADFSDAVLGIDPRDKSPVDPGPFTAAGVFVGITAAVSKELASSSLQDLTVLVQGVGDVGAPLARSLAAHGAKLAVSDIDAGKTNDLARELGAIVVDAADVPSFACDIYAPCAIGATLNSESIPRLECRIVAGSANNQLLHPTDADLLHKRGILYLPDYIVNAGGALAFALMNDGVLDRKELMLRVGGIGETVTSLLAEAAGSDITPLEAARRRVEQTLSG